MIRSTSLFVYDWIPLYSLYKITRTADQSYFNMSVDLITHNNLSHFVFDLRYTQVALIVFAEVVVASLCS